MCTSNIKKYKTLIMIITIIFLLVNKTDAATCTSSEKTNLNKEAKNIEIIPYMDEEYNPLHEYSYSVYITNFSEKFYILDSKNNRFEFDESYTNDSVFGLYEPGEKVVFKVYGAYSKTCSDILLTSFTVKFDHYNDYSTYKECEGIEEFYLCKRNYSGDIESEEWFLEQVKGYKEGNVENIEIEEPKEEKDNIIDFFRNNKVISIILMIVIIISVICLIVFFIKDKKKIKIKIKEDKDRGDDYE